MQNSVWTRMWMLCIGIHRQPVVFRLVGLGAFWSKVGIQYSLSVHLDDRKCSSYASHETRLTKVRISSHDLCARSWGAKD